MFSILKTSFLCFSHGRRNFHFFLFSSSQSESSSCVERNCIISELIFIFLVFFLRMREGDGSVCCAVWAVITCVSKNKFLCGIFVDSLESVMRDGNLHFGGISTRLQPRSQLACGAPRFIDLLFALCHEECRREGSELCWCARENVCLGRDGGKSCEREKRKSFMCKIIFYGS